MGRSCRTKGRANEVNLAAAIEAGQLGMDKGLGTLVFLKTEAIYSALGGVSRFIHKESSK